ncbi:MAG: tetratricopeptide repeat protein [Actinomycetota bacterium]
MARQHGAGAARRRFHNAVAAAVDQLGGDRTAERLSGVSKSIWYDTKTGRSLPDGQRTWPAMRVLLERVAPSRTGVDDWDALYQRVRAEAGGPRHSPTARHREQPIIDLPADTAHLLGRDQALETIIATLTTADGVPGSSPLCVVHGMAGVGKTAVAIRAARQLGSRYPDGRLFLDVHAHTPHVTAVPPAEMLGRVLRRLGVGYEHVPPHIDERAALLRRRLAGRRLLLVLDDAHDAQAIRLLLPAESGCGVLITSRSRLVTLDDAVAVELRPLASNDAASLFRALVTPTPGTTTQTEAPEQIAIDRIVLACANLPLAIRIAAARFRASGRAALAVPSVESMPDQERIAELDDGERSIAAAVMSSHHELSVPESELFDLLTVVPGPDLDPFAAAALAALDGRHRAAEALDGLCIRHLLEQHRPDRYRFHDLVGAVARVHAQPRLTPADRHAALRRLAAYYLHGAERADRLLTPHRHRIRTQPDDPPPSAPDLGGHDDALAWFVVEDDNLAAACLAAGAAGLDDLCWRLAYALKGYYFLAKRWEPWLATHRAALVSTRRLNDRRAEAITSNHIGLATIEHGDVAEARTWFRRALELFRTVGDAHGEHTALANAAWILFDEQDYQGFLNAMEPSLDFYRRYGADRNAAITQRGIALAEMGVGRTAAARSRLSEALETFTELGLLLDIAMTLNCLGEVAATSGAHRTAVDYHRRALDAAIESGSTFESARAAHRLGDLASAAGRDGEAQARWREALSGYEALGAPQAGELRDHVRDRSPDRSRRPTASGEDVGQPDH